MAAMVSAIVTATTIATVIAGHLPAAATDAKPFTLELAIHNNFQAYNLTIQCDSDLEEHPDKHLVRPNGMYEISFDVRIPHQWTCALSTQANACGKAAFSSRFIMWQNHMPIPPMREPMCEDHGKCPWLVDAKGLALIRHPGDEPMHIYDWPAQECLGSHC